MLRAKLIIFTFIGIIGFGFVIAVPIGVLSVNFSSFSSINKSLSYEYLPDTPSEVERLDLNVDIGDIEIKYIEPPVDFFVRIDVDIEMAGPGLVGKSYLDYLNVTKSDNSSSHIEFSIRILPGITISEMESVIKVISITVFLRKDIMFEISATIIKGDIDLEVPFKVSINNILFNLMYGDIFFDLYNCIIEGNVTGLVDNGKIRLISYNAEYTQNSVWTLSSNKNYIDITQQNPMGANVTGSITTAIDDGTYLIYNDTTPEVGAKFTLYNYFYPHIQNGPTVNFEFDIVPEGTNRYCYFSNDFPASCSYDLNLFIGGILNFDLYSE